MLNISDALEVTNLQVSDLQVGYEGVTHPTITIDHITCAPGTVTCLRGPNGAGKSTLLAALVGSPDVWVTGNIAWQGLVDSQTPLHMRARAGFLYIPQHSLEIPGLPAPYMLMCALRAQGMTASLPEVTQQVAEAYTQVGLDAQEWDAGLHVGMSGGQKRRAELTQILVLKPRVILIDEVDAHIDAAGKELVAQLLASYIITHPDTIVIMATHSQDLIDQLAHRHVPIASVWLAQGKVVRS
jgi:Fe-S cluster assembly ATP-binding protein